MNQHGVHLLSWAAVGLLLSAAQCSSEQASNNQQNQELARRLTPELMAKYVKYEEAMVPYAWHRYTFLTRHKLSPEHQEAFGKGQAAAAKTAAINSAEAMAMHLLLAEYVMHKVSVTDSAHFLDTADERLRRADGGARAMWADIKKETMVEIEDHRRKALTFEAEYGESVVGVIAPHVASLFRLYYFQLTEQPIPSGMKPFD